MPLQIAHAQRHANAIFSKRFARRTEHARAALEASRSQRNVGGHRDVALADLLGDPIVCRIGPLCDRDVSYERVSAWSEPAIADDVDDKSVTAGHPLDFRLHRTGIAVDIYLKHGSSQSSGLVVL